MAEIEIKREHISKISINVRSFKNEDDFLNAFDEYLSWVSSNYFEEEVPIGKGIGELKRMRPVSIEGFCTYLRHTPPHFAQMVENNKLRNALDFIQNCIFSMTFEAASAGLIKEGIIIRKLGLADKKETTNTEKRVVILHTPDNGRMIEISESSED